MDWTPVIVAAAIAFVLLLVARARYPAARGSRLVTVVTATFAIGLLVFLLAAAVAVIAVLGNRGP